MGSPSDGVLSDEEVPEEDSQDEDDNHQWSGSGRDEVSLDGSDQDSN